MEPGARGVDRLGEGYARQRGLPCKIFPAQWTKYGKSAGPRRNREMADYADYGVAIWDGKSVGTAHMIRLMEGRVFVVIYCQSPEKAWKMFDKRLPKPVTCGKG